MRVDSWEMTYKEGWAILKLYQKGKSPLLIFPSNVSFTHCSHTAEIANICLSQCHFMHLYSEKSWYQSNCSWQLFLVIFSQRLSDQAPTSERAPHYRCLAFFPSHSPPHTPPCFCPALRSGVATIRSSGLRSTSALYSADAAEQEMPRVVSLGI